MKLFFEDNILVEKLNLSDLYDDPALEQIWDDAFNKLVPKAGTPDSDLGKLLLSFARLSRAYLQNGDMLNKGWANQSTYDAGNDLDDIVKKLNDSSAKLLADKLWATRSESAYDTYLAKLYLHIVNTYLK